MLWHLKVCEGFFICFFLLFFLTLNGRMRTSVLYFRHEVVKEGMARYDTDGLNTLEYETVSYTREPLYTNITIKLLHEDPYENYVKPEK